VEQSGGGKGNRICLSALPIFKRIVKKSKLLLKNVKKRPIFAFVETFLKKFLVFDKFF
jgi:hypothetical protein